MSDICFIIQILKNGVLCGLLIGLVCSVYGLKLISFFSVGILSLVWYEEQMMTNRSDINDFDEDIEITIDDLDKDISTADAEKDILVKRRKIDDLLEKRRLEKELQDSYDDFDDDFE